MIILSSESLSALRLQQGSFQSTASHSSEQTINGSLKKSDDVKVASLASSLFSSSSTSLSSSACASFLSQLQEQSNKEPITYDTISLDSSQLTKKERSILLTKGLLCKLEACEKAADAKNIALHLKENCKGVSENRELTKNIFKYELICKQIELKKARLSCLLDLKHIDFFTYFSLMNTTIMHGVSERIHFVASEVHVDATFCCDTMFTMLESITAERRQKLLPQVLQEIESVIPKLEQGNVRSYFEKQAKMLHYLSQTRMFHEHYNYIQKIINEISNFFREIDSIMHYSNQEDLGAFFEDFLTTLQQYERKFRSFFPTSVTEQQKKDFTELDSFMETVSSGRIQEGLEKGATGRDVAQTVADHVQLAKDSALLYDVWAEVVAPDIVKIIHGVLSFVAILKTECQERIYRDRGSTQSSSLQQKKEAPQSEEKGLGRHQAATDIEEAVNALQITSKEVSSSQQAEHPFFASQLATANVQAGVAEWMAGWTEVRCQKSKKIKLPSTLTIKVLDQKELLVWYDLRIAMCFQAIMSSSIEQDGHRIALAIDRIAFNLGRREVHTRNQRTELRIAVPVVVEQRHARTLIGLVGYAMVIEAKVVKLYHRCFMELRAKNLSKWYSEELIEYFHQACHKIASFSGKTEALKEKKCRDGSHVTDQTTRGKETLYSVQDPRNDAIIKLLIS